MDKKNKADLQPNSQNQNVMHNLMLRDCGLLTNHQFNTKEFEKIAEKNLIRKELKETKCDLPGTPKTTFLMVFSPDGTKVASTHGNHNIYITDVCTGRNIKILSGHPRTPWCIAFHPTSNKILASGCLGGQVRVWDLSGGSAVWNSRSQIASLAFHPVERLIAIASYNEIHFWDWGHKEPFTSVSTKSTAEKVRYVAFDKMGSKLITGIANPLGFHFRPTGRFGGIQDIQRIQDIHRHFDFMRRRAQSYFNETSNLDETENPSSNSSNNNNSENNLENESTSQNMTFARVTPRIVVPHVLVEVVRHQDRNNTSPTISIDTSRTEPRVDNSVGENEEERPGSTFRNLFEASQVDGNINNSSNREENAAATNFSIFSLVLNTSEKLTIKFKNYIQELNGVLDIIVQFLRGLSSLPVETEEYFIESNLIFISTKFFIFDNAIRLVETWLDRLRLRNHPVTRIEQRLLYLHRHFRNAPIDERRNSQFHRIQHISQFLESTSARLNRLRLGVRTITDDECRNRANNRTLNQNQLNVLQQRMMSSIIGEESTINTDTQENSDSVGDEQTNQTNDPQTSTLRPGVRRQLDRNDDDDQPRATKRRLNSDSDTNVRHAEGFSETCMGNDEHTNVIYQSHPFQFSGSSQSAFQPIRASLLHRIKRLIEDLGYLPDMNMDRSNIMSFRMSLRVSFQHIRERQIEVRTEINSDFQMLETYLHKSRTTQILPSSRHAERIRSVLAERRESFLAERRESFLPNAQPTTSNSDSHTEPARNFKKTLLEMYIRQAQERGTNTDILQPQPSTSRGSTSTIPYHGNRVSQSQPSTSTTSSTASINSMSTNSVNDSEPSTSSSSNTIDLGDVAISQLELVNDAKRIRRMIFRAIYPDANQNNDENNSSSDSSDNDSHESSSSSDRSDNDSHEPSTSTSQCNNTTTTIDSTTNRNATTSNNNSGINTNENTNNADFASAQDRINSLYRSFRTFVARQHTHTNTFYASTVSNVPNNNRLDAIEFVLLQIKRMSDFLTDVVTNTVGSETEKSDDVIRKFVKLLTRSCHEFILLRRDIENRRGPTSSEREADSDINVNKLIKLICNIKKRRDSILKSVLALLNVLRTTHTYFENLARPLKVEETLRNVFNSTIRNIVIHPTNPESPSAFTASSSNNGTENDNLLTNNTRNESPLSAEIQSIFERIQNNETNNSNDATQRIPNRNRTSFYPNNESDNSEDEEGYHTRRCNRLLQINRINRITNMHQVVFNHSLRRLMNLQHYERVLRSEANGSLNLPSNNAHNNDDSSSSRRIFSRSRLNRPFRPDPPPPPIATRLGSRHFSRGNLARILYNPSHRYSNLGNNDELRNDVRNLANEVFQATSHFLNRFRTQEYLSMSYMPYMGRSRQENSNGEQDPEYVNDYVEMFRDHQLGIPFNGLEFLSYRIQAWDFSSIPDIQDPEKNVIVPECKIHNDASIDISSDGTLLATILPRYRTMAAIGLYSLEWDTLGKRVHFTHMRETIISVSISPAKKHLLVGLATRRLLTLPEPSAMAFIYELVEPAEHDRSKVCYSNNHLKNMELLRKLYQDVEDSSPNQMSLNCIRWAPQPGQGIVYATNTGLLNMLR